MANDTVAGLAARPARHPLFLSLLFLHLDLSEVGLPSFLSYLLSLQPLNFCQPLLYALVAG